MKGVFSGTLNLESTSEGVFRRLSRSVYTLNGNFGSEVKVILKVTLALLTVDDTFVVEGAAAAAGVLDAI